MFAEFILKKGKVADRDFRLARFSHFNDRRIAFRSSPMDIKKGRSYFQRLLPAHKSSIQKSLENVVGTTF